MALPIGSSPNISIFDFLVEYNLNTQEITLTNNSTYIGGGAAATQGIDFVLTSPSGYNSSSPYYDNDTYGVDSDITPTAPNTPFVQAMPAFNGSVEYGNWKVVGSIKDGDGTIYTMDAIVTNICKPSNQISNTSDAAACITFVGNCVANEGIYEDKTVYVFKGLDAASVEYDVTMYYPRSSGKTAITNADVAFFSDSPLFDGIYSFVIENTATYEVGDNVTVVIVYKVNQDFPISCSIKLCDILCVYDKYIQNALAAISAKAYNAATYQANLLTLNSYVNEAIIKANCGMDLSELIAKIEAITGEKCNCGCGGNNTEAISPTQDVVIKGECGTTVDTVTVGNTTTFTISSRTTTITTNTDGITISVDEGVCGDEYSVDICVDSLPFCNSTLSVNNGEGGATNVATGTPLMDVLELFNTAVDNLYNEDVSLQAQIVAVPTWIDVTDGEMTDWTNLIQMAYTKDAHGWVTLRGEVQAVDVPQSSIIVNLPAGYRPPQNAVFGVCVFDGGAGDWLAGQLTIAASNGQIKVEWTAPAPAGDTSLLGLDGIRFNINA